MSPDINNPESKKQVAYIYDKSLCYECNRIPPVVNRASLVHDLIESYNLLNLMSIVKSEEATEEDLKLCHSSSYIDFIKSVNDSEDLEQFEHEEDEFGLGYDCPILEKLYNFSKIIAGGSLTAARLLTSKEHNTVINWFGGWHHAQRESAEGFCYVNDIAIAIQALTKSFQRVLYIDFDIHHGNGVQNLFETSQKVLTLSFHKHTPGFYPGSGSISDLGYLKGKYYALNVPFLEGYSDKSLLYSFHHIFPKVFEVFQPLSIVVQCGADCIKGDPLGEVNITPVSVGECVKKILDKNIPTLFLGGGGYNFSNTARHWTYLTSVILNQTLSSDIPEESEYFSEYGPDFELEITPGNMKDTNTKEYLDNIVQTITYYCEKIKLNE